MFLLSSFKFPTIFRDQMVMFYKPSYMLYNLFWSTLSPKYMLTNASECSRRWVGSNLAARPQDQFGSSLHRMRIIDRNRFCKSCIVKCINQPLFWLKLLFSQKPLMSRFNRNRFRGWGWTRSYGRECMVPSLNPWMIYTITMPIAEGGAFSQARR